MKKKEFLKKCPILKLRLIKVTPGGFSKMTSREVSGHLSGISEFPILSLLFVMNYPNYPFISLKLQTLVNI